MKKLLFFLVLFFSLVISKAQQKLLTGVYARIEYNDPVYDMDVVTGPGGYSTGFQFATPTLRFYSDAACTSPATLPQNVYVHVQEHYVQHDIARNVSYEDYVEDYSSLLVTAGTSSVVLDGFTFQFYYENIAYSSTAPYGIIRDDLESSTVEVTELSPGGVLTVVTPKFNFAISPYYYF